jgi:3-hydroxymyristoyl/3-hydroxydecanoyl-(acyl carrier protein) dehydratase
MRSFIGPGQVVEIRVDLQRQDATTFTVALAARVGGKQVATGRVAIAPRVGA